MTFTIHADPGHAWVAVPKSTLKELGIESEISHYSYQDGGTAFLEEDCDMQVFVQAYSNLRGCRPEFHEVHTNRESPIRHYAPYTH